MRIAALVAVSLLIAGCSREVGGDVGQSQTIAPPAPAPSAAPSTPPAAGAPITTIVSWIEAGHPVDPAAYHVATRDGVTTQLGDDVAFSASSGTVACMTDARHTSGTLACLVRLANPPPRPETAYGEWKGGWVDFDGIHLQVGSARADQGPFVYGNGPELANGDTLSIGDYRCRSYQAGLFCVNYAHQSAVRFASAGIEPFGCLKPAPPPDGVGVAFGC
ncbi:hypothetical protein [Mycobacterium tuberculosis]|uniref:hypothetical protein n=1 Tax=Mycobacterium tuberculosis TaxID=1773 RepID=UPI000A7AA56C